MFFVLSKTLGFLSNPLVLVIGLFGASIFFKPGKIKRALFLLAFSMLLFFSNDFIANEVMSAWEIPVTPYSNMNSVYTYGIVLTGVTSTDRMPDDRVYFHHGADRVVHAVELYKKGIIKKVIISGGSGRLVTEGRREADDLYKAMILMGIPSVDLVIESQSRNTYESAVNVKKLLQKSTNQKSLLITSAFHMRRSAACFKRASVNVDLFTTDFYSHPRYFTPDSILIPQVDAIASWQKIFKEWVGYTFYFLVGYI